jgi:O-antigen ligase
MVGVQPSTFHLKPQPDVLREIVRSRWFAIADLLIVSTCAVIWTLRPGVGWWPLLLALPPWITRIASGTLPFSDVRIDLPLAIFVATAGIGVSAAYNRDAAWAKFWIIVAAILLYYALANQPRANLWLVAGYLASLGVIMAIYFLLTHDWQAQPAKVDLLNRLGLWWMSVRPVVRAQPVHPNGAAGVMAILAPFLLALCGRAWKQKQKVKLALVLLASAFVVFSFLLTTSRGAWLALGSALGIWLVWAFSRRLSDWVPIKRTVVFGLFVLISVGVVAAYVLTYPGGALGFANTLPGPAQASTRLDLAQSAFDLVGDFLYTGGGLGAFPGLYSHYIRSIPFLYLNHSHNLFLDVAVEQGLFAALALVGIILAGVWLLVNAPPQLANAPAQPHLLRWAIFASGFALVIHGLLDDPLYGGAGTPFLFLPVGMATAVTKNRWRDNQVIGWGDSWTVAPQVRSLFRPRKLTSALFLAIIFAVSLFAIRNSEFAIRDSLLSTWYADLGAVHMSQIELADFPSGRWDDGSQVAALTSAEGLFQKALQLNPNNRTAHHRLGLIAMLRRDFPTALAHLEKAHHLDPSHRGIRKSLGYTYVWAGQLDLAKQVLAQIPEAQQELDVYIWWWGTQNRPDLSARAKEATLILKSQQ